MEVFKPNKKTVEYDKKKLVKGKKVGEGNTAKIFRAGYGFWKGLIRKERQDSHFEDEEQFHNALENYNYLKSIGAKVPKSLRYVKGYGFLVSDLSENGKYNVESGSKANKETSNSINEIKNIKNFETEVVFFLSVLRKITKKNKVVSSDAYFIRYLREHKGEISIDIIFGDIDAMDFINTHIDDENLFGFHYAICQWLKQKVYEGKMSQDLSKKYEDDLERIIEKEFDIQIKE